MRARMSNPETRRRRLTLLATCVATFMISLDVTIVNVALPSMQRELHMTPGALEWVISAYSLSLAALVPVGGALGDHWGRKRVFLSGMVVFGLGSVGCALSSSAVALVAFRAVQGVGGAAMLALALSIITETFPPAGRAGAIGAWAAIGGTGFGAGPVVGGILLTWFGWASVFWVNVPFALAGVLGTMVAVRESRNPRSRRLDVPGVVTSAVGLVAVTLGLIESASHPWGSWPVASSLLTGAAFLAGFALWERRARHAMVPPTLLRARSFTSASAIYLIGYAGLSAVLFYVTLLYQGANGWSVLRTGLSWLLMNAPFLLMAQFAGRLDRRFPAAAVAATGCLVAALGIFALSLAGTATPFALTALGYLLFGAGFGTLIPGDDAPSHARRARRCVGRRLRGVERLPADRHVGGTGGARRRRCPRRGHQLDCQGRPVPGLDPRHGVRTSPERGRSTPGHRRRCPRLGLPASRRPIVRARLPPRRRCGCGLPAGRRGGRLGGVPAAVAGSVTRGGSRRRFSRGRRSVPRRVRPRTARIAGGQHLRAG